MRSAMVSYCFGFLSLAGCASAPGYRSPAVQPPASFREVTQDSQPPASSPDGSEGRHPLAPAPESPHPLTPSPSGRGGTQDEPAVSTEYWDQLGDTTLSRLIGEVQRANLDVRAARARVSAARSDRVRSALELTPATTVSAGYARQRLSSVSFPGASGVFPDQSVWNAGVDAAWDLDVFGRIRHTVQAQGALVGVAQEELRDVQVSFTAELARAYFELRGAQEQLAVARRNADNQRRTFELTRQRLDAGRGSAFDTERAQAQLSSTLASIPAREAQVAAAQYRVGTLVGRSPSEVARDLEQARQLPPLPDVIAALEDMETSLARYRSARLQVERLQEASAASERAAELARLRFSEGITDFLQVLDAERTELEAQDRLAQGRIDAATAYAALYKAGAGRRGRTRGLCCAPRSRRSAVWRRE